MLLLYPQIWPENGKFLLLDQRGLVFYLDPPQPPPAQLGDTVLKKISINKIVLDEKILDNIPTTTVIVIEQNDETSVIKSSFHLQPPQPPPASVDDVAVKKSVQKTKILETFINVDVFLKDPVREEEARCPGPTSCLRLEPASHPPLIEINDLCNFCCPQPRKHFSDEDDFESARCTYPSSHDSTAAPCLFDLEPPPTVPVDIGDKIFQTCAAGVIRKYVGDLVQQEVIAFLPSTLQHLETNPWHSMLVLEAPQSPSVELSDSFSHQKTKIKEICSCIRKPALAHLIPPLIDIKETKYLRVSLFRLDPPQHPPCEIDDSALKTRSKIRNISSSVKDSESLIVFFPLKLETEYEFCSSLLKLDTPPQPPLHDLEDKIKNSESKMKTLDELNVKQDILKIDLIRQPQKPDSDASLFRLEAPQEPLLELEDSYNQVQILFKEFPDQSKPDPIVHVPEETPESFIIEKLLAHWSSQDLQKPEVEIKDEINNSGKLSRSNVEISFHETK